MPFGVISSIQAYFCSNSEEQTGSVKTYNTRSFDSVLHDTQAFPFKISGFSVRIISDLETEGEPKYITQSRVNRGSGFCVWMERLCKQCLVISLDRFSGGRP